MSNFFRNGLRASAAICTLAFALPDRAEAGEAVDLDTLTVSAGRGTSLDKMDVATTVVTREQIQNAPETGVDQILNKVPGIFIPQRPANLLHPTGQELSIRGFGTATNELVLVLVDGVPVNDPYFRTVNWSQIPKNTIERIEIIRGGGATSLWGNMAMGGVINIITRRPGDKEAIAQASYGSFNTATLDTSLGYKIDDLWRIGLTYDGLRSDGYNPTPAGFRGVSATGVPTMGTTSSVVNNVTASLYFTPSEKSNYYLKFLFDRVNENGLIYALTSNYWSTYRIQAGGSTEIAPNTTVNFNGWFQGNTYGTVNVAENGLLSTYAVTPAGATGVSVPIVTLNENANYQNLGASTFLQSSYGNFTDIKVGADFRDIWLTDAAQAFRARKTCAGNLCTGELDARASHLVEGLFVQATYRVAPLPLDITLGLREDFWQAVNASLNDVNVPQSLPDASASHFDPRLGAKYDLGRGFDARAAVYENFSAPGMNQMYRSFLSTALTIANPNLRPQTNTGGEIGADYKGDRFDLSATVYRNVVEKYIDLVPGLTCTGVWASICTSLGANGGARQYQNVGTALIQGVEVYGNWRVTDTLTLDAGFARTEAHLTSATAASTSASGLDTVGAQLGQVPPWMATLGAAWNITPALSVKVTGKVFSTFWQYTNHAYQQPNQGAFTADVGVTYAIDSHVEVFAYVQNIGNVYYYDQGAILGTGGAPPQLAMPLSATGGVRATF